MVARLVGRNRLTMLRVVTALFGAMLVVVALVPHWLGLAHSADFGGTQLVVLLVGLLLVVVACLGRRVVGVYRGTAIIGLNTVVLFIILELGAAVALHVSGLEAEEEEDGGVPEEMELRYYQARPWGRQLWKEDTLQQDEYHPYILWRKKPFRGRAINIGEGGIRRTPGADCRSDSYTVFTFGGSTMWGIGSPDWGTIPAYLQAGLSKSLGRPVCVVNYGEQAYTSTQSLIQLMRRLQVRDVPDLVIFYSGVNDISAAFQWGEAGLHWDVPEIASRLEGTERRPGWVDRLNLVRLLSRFVDLRRTEPQSARYRRAQGVVAAGLDQRVARVYLSNTIMAAALARAYGFDHVFFWQPNIFVGDKPLTDEEQLIKRHPESIRPTLVSLTKQVYGHIQSAASKRKDLYSLANIFDAHPSFLYIDWHHLVPEGNQLVAQHMLDIIARRHTRSDASQGVAVPDDTE